VKDAARVERRHEAAIVEHGSHVRIVVLDGRIGRVGVVKVDEAIGNSKKDFALFAVLRLVERDDAVRNRAVEQRVGGVRPRGAVPERDGRVR